MIPGMYIAGNSDLQAPELPVQPFTWYTHTMALRPGGRSIVRRGSAGAQKRFRTRLRHDLASFVSI